MAGTLLSAAALDAKVFYVDGFFQGENYTGESWLSAFPSVQEAIDAAHAEGGGEIRIKAGVYKPSGDGRTATFQLAPRIELYGGFRGNETDLEQRNPKANRTVLSGDIGRISARGDNCHHVVTGASQSRIDGFIVMAGSADGDGEQGRGGALLLGSEVTDFTAANCIFEKNNAASGGAIHSLAHGTTLTNCTFYSNSADTGGAFSAGLRTLTRFDGCIFSSNYSKQSGGAVALGSGADAGFSGCSFLSNSTKGEGGAVSAATDRKDGIRLGFTECTFSENSAREGGGAVAHRGPFKPALSKCRFLNNVSSEGAGAVANLDGATADLANSTFSGNRGIKGMENIGGNPAAASRPAIQSPEKPEAKPVVAKPVPNPQPAPRQKRKLDDVFVHNNSGTKVKLRSIVGGGELTVLVLGELTDPGFISSYRGVEAAALDYAPKGVNFFYIYHYLAHPENNGYIQPFTLDERARQMADAANLLHTRVPWLCDTMDNQAAKALEQKSDNLFIFNQDGLEEYAGQIDDEPALRSALRGLAGETATPTALQSIARPDLKPVDMPQARVVKRVVTDPQREKFLPLQTTPLDSRAPFCVKMRVEANEELLKTGNGRMVLGFHIDPIYAVEWNNLGSTLAYAMKVPAGSAVAPSANEAEKVTQQVTDTDPREFLLEARKLNLSQPIAITVSYSVYASASKRNLDLVQEYMIYLDRDRFGGDVFGRQIPAPGESKPPKGKPNTPGRFGDLLRRFDIDRDGALSRDEAPDGLRSRWNDADANRDGKVDGEEYTRYQAASS
jgi:predicted outer membrane repeat protein